MKSEKLSLTGVAEKLRVIADEAVQADKDGIAQQRLKWRISQRKHRRRTGQSDGNSAQYAEEENL